MTIVGGRTEHLNVGLDATTAQGFLASLGSLKGLEWQVATHTVREKSKTSDVQGRIVLSFEDRDSDGELETVTTELSRNELAIHLEKVEQRGGIGRQIRMQLAAEGIAPDLPDPVYSNLNLKEDKDLAILQREGAYASATHPILASNGAGPCVIVALYDPITHKAFEAHLDAATDLEELRAAFETLKASRENPDEPQPIDVHAVGGNERPGFAAQVLDRVDQLSGVVIKSAHLDRSHTNGNALAIDARTGKITDQVWTTDLDITHDRLEAHHTFLLAGPVTTNGKRALRIVP